MASKILLLGSTGIIGRTILDNMEVIPITRNDCDLLNAVEVKNLLNKHSPDILINCAGNISETESFHDLIIFDNIRTCKDSFGKYIQFGSGAEFDRAYSIDDAQEIDILKSNPNDAYGYVKNAISKFCLNEENFYTLRLFGLYSKYDTYRFFSKARNTNFEFHDRKFDYFSSHDLITVVKYFCEKDHPAYKDVNLVYKDKYRLSDYLFTIYAYNKSKIKPKFKRVEKNYTGSHKRLYSLGLPLVGLGEELKGYTI